MSTRHTLPTGTVTFLFTDIEGSTRLVEKLGDAWVAVLERHDYLVSDAIARHDGVLVKSEGDSLFAVFGKAAEAVRAAVDAQLALAAEQWPKDAPVEVRMGLHTGSGVLGGSDYVGIDVHRAARISAAAHGGQVVISETTAVLVDRDRIEGVHLHDLGKHRLKDLSDPETILQVSIEGLRQEFPPLRTLDAIPNNLPAQVTSFVGREALLAEALRLLTTSRALTLTGPGGTGKSRLALQIAAESIDNFEDGVFFVDLSPVSQADLVPSVILSSLGISSSAKNQAPEDRLVEQLRPMAVLLILDNFEHVLEAASVVSSLVHGAPKAKFVVTSRAPLRIRGEQELPVPPLAMAGTGNLEAVIASESVLLFVERAMAVRPDFRVDESNAAAVVELVRKLDGLPLAIELVASRLRVLPVESIVRRLDTRMLGSGSVDLPERHQTIHNTIAWSYDLLDASLQSLFNRLSVFPGWARLEEIEEFLEGWQPDHDLLDGLAHLTDQSLLSSGPVMGSPGFRMLHVIREFAADRLVESGEADQAHLGHLQVYTELAKRAEPELLRKERLYWFDLLEANHDNIRAALDWGIEHQKADLVFQLVWSTWRFWQARGYLHEAQRRIAGALELSGGEPRLRAKAMEAMGGVLWWRGDLARCVDVYGDVLEIQRELGESRDLAVALYNYSLAYGYHMKDYETSGAMLEEARGIFAKLNDEGGLGDIAWGNGNNRLLDTDLEPALTYFLEAVDHYRRAGNEFGVGWALFEAGDIKRRSGAPADAWPILEEALTLFAGHRDVSGVIMVLSELAGVARDLGDSSRAYRLQGAVNALRQTSGVDIVGIDVNTFEGLDQESLAHLTGADAERLAEGAAWTMEEAVEYGLAGPTDANLR